VASICDGVATLHTPFCNMTTTPDGSQDIDSIGRHCLTIFRQIYRLLSESTCVYREDITPDDVEDELGRFKIWGGNIGAFQPISMATSLEHRLRDASRTREQVLKLLQDLEESLELGT
jgi:hypothetical protein